MIDEYIVFFPSVHLEDFSPFINKQIEQYIKIGSQKFHMDELDSLPKERRRTKRMIEEHCRSGIRKEVAFAMIHELNPITHVDFEIHESSDRYDIAVDDTYIDITTANPLGVRHPNKDFFDIAFSLSKDKYDSILDRSRNDWYLAKEIAFLKQRRDKIYYLGQIDIKNLLSKRYKKEIRENRPVYCFVAKGKRTKQKSSLAQKILLT